MSSGGGGGGYIKQLGLNQPITVQNTVSCQLTLRITRTEQEGVTGVVAVVISLSGSQILTVTQAFIVSFAASIQNILLEYSHVSRSSLDVSLLVIER